MAYKLCLYAYLNEHALLLLPLDYILYTITKYDVYKVISPVSVAASLIFMPLMHRYAFMRFCMRNISDFRRRNFTAEYLICYIKNLISKSLPLPRNFNNSEHHDKFMISFE